MSIDLNFIVENGANKEEDKQIFWKLLSSPPNRPETDEGPEWDAWANGRVWSNEPIIPIDHKANMFDVLALAGVFPSKSEARKNWKGPVEIPLGFSEFTIGKLKHKITILNVADPAAIQKQSLPNSRVEDKRIDNVA